MYSGHPYSVSSDFGQLAVSRHLNSGIDWAIAGAATPDAARPTPAAFRNSRRFMAFPLFWSLRPQTVRNCTRTSRLLPARDRSADVTGGRNMVNDEKPRSERPGVF